MHGTRNKIRVSFEHNYYIRINQFRRK